ncbi:MAG: hypothetical protein ACUVRV_00635 [Cyanobacteriota bacterium]
MGNSANFGITEGIPYDRELSQGFRGWSGEYHLAILHRLFSINIVLATVMGMILEVACFSSNWLARQLATIITNHYRDLPQYPGAADHHLLVPRVILT